jgi:peptidoglycan/xylan/chitin deacetylase (PgdA/CDA1 family)
MLRNLVKTGAASALHWTGVTRWIRKDAPLVLSYHRVVDDFSLHSQDSIPAMLISVAMLERQLDWIGSRYRFVSLDELATSLQGKKSFPKPLAAVTFDDGYQDVYDHAWPLLKRKGIPAALFVVTDVIGTSKLQYHDKLYLLLVMAFASKVPSPRELLASLLALDIPPLDPQNFGNGDVDYSKAVNSLLGVLPQCEIERLIGLLEKQTGLVPGPREAQHALTWEMVKKMHQSGVVVGSHTRTHAVLPNESQEKIRDEIEGSRRELEQRLGARILHFAYPDGRFNDSTVKALASSGYRFAYTTGPIRRSDCPLLTIPRRVLWEKSCVDPVGRFSPALLDCLVSGLFDFGLNCNGGYIAHSLRGSYEVNV